jgi:class 3 adenylate cyclase/tetratricopeptide (TPR) repeat protein
VLCSNCGTENRAGRKFCSRCAAPLVIVCVQCHSPNEPGELFCGECASPLQTTGGLPAETRPFSRPVSPAGGLAAPAAAPVAERRLVTILFADLVGFTTLAEGRDAEDTRELLSRYFDLARDVIGRYGGTVEKFIGDAVMAVWGAPAAHEDDAERAVRAGLDLLDAVKSLGPGITARAGILTGEAAVTIGATNQGMVAGDMVNTASRLQSVAAPGTVLVGEATERAASKAIVFEAAGDQALKGKAAPVLAWRALRVVAERGGRKRSETLEAPFVGRDEELRQLKDLFHATSREKRARLVSVIGPAGIGKTRLAWEFLKYIDGLVENVWWHDGRSPAYGDGISFWALGEMVRERAGLLETDDEQTTRVKIAETLATHVPDETERRWIEPALLVLLGVESGVNSEQLFGAWRTFFERLAAAAPVVIVFEDFHFADSGLIDFVDHLMEWSRSHPIYVVTLSRPELLEKRPDWGAGKRNFNSLYLEPLSPAAMGELLAGLVPGLPELAVRAIVDRADGIPLYAVETVRMLLSDGRLALDGGAYHPVGDLTALAVPETLTALIASRLDGLAPEDRALVSDAAVLGQSFTLAGLSAVSGMAEAELEPRLHAFVRRELLTLEADPRSPERGQYAFVQALIREVAYHTLAKADRKRRHLAAARLFESLGSDELAGGLAGHYLAAHQNAAEGPEADALAAQARIALRAAAERATALGSHDQALTFLQQALTVTTDPAEEAELHERAGESASAGAHHDRADALLRRALELQRDRGDRPASARVIAALGRALLAPFRTEQALAVLEPAADELADLGADTAFVALLGQLARAYMMHGDGERSIQVADRVLAAAERADLVVLVADTLVTKGTALGGLGRGYEGLGGIETGLHLAEWHGLAVTAVRARLNRGWLLSQGDPREALENDRVGLAEARRLGQRGWSLVFLTNAAMNARWTGDWDWALLELDELLAGDLEREGRIFGLSSSIQIRAWRGDPVDELLDEVERLAGDTPDRQVLSGAAEARADRTLARGELNEAAAAYRRAAALHTGNAPGCHVLAARASLRAGDPAAAASDLAALEAIGVRGPAIDARRSSIRAGLAALEGRGADALALYREGVRRFRDAGLPLDEALTAIEMATLLDPADPEVRAEAEAAREILTRLGATPLLRRLESAMGRSAPEQRRIPAEEASERSAATAS